MPYWICYYHVIWATHEREHLITPEMEKLILNTIQHRTAELKCAMLALNGTTNHLHAAVCIKPSLSVSQWVGQMKGASSHAVNIAYATISFRWQESYGVLTFGTKHRVMVESYIARQKEHHVSGNLIDALERTEEK